MSRLAVVVRIAQIKRPSLVKLLPPRFCRYSAAKMSTSSQARMCREGEGASNDEAGSEASLIKVMVSLPMPSSRSAAGGQSKREKELAEAAAKTLRGKETERLSRILGRWGM